MSVRTLQTNVVSNQQERRTAKIVSLHWGFLAGGVAQYGHKLDSITKIEPIQLTHLCILGDRWSRDDATLERLAPSIISIRSRLDFSWVRRLGRKLSDYQPDLVITHGVNGHVAMIVMSTFGYYRGKLACSYHGRYHPTSTLRRIVAPVFNFVTERYIRRSVVSAVTVSDASKRYLVSRGINREKLTVVHNGVTPAGGPSNQSIRQEWRVPDSAFVVGTLSRIDPIKGLDFLIDAFSRIAASETFAERQNVHLVIIGEGAHRDALQNRVTNLNLDEHVTFTGYRPDTEACFSAFDLFAMPSLSENHSIALLEAMRAGLPIVTTDVGGNTESVRPDLEALVVEPANADQLHDALVRLIDDRELRNRLSVAALDRFRTEFTDDRMISKTAAWAMKALESTQDANRVALT